VQAYPFVARKVLRDDGSGTAALLRDLVYDEQGKLRPGRLSALLQVGACCVSSTAVQCFICKLWPGTYESRSKQGLRIGVQHQLHPDAGIPSLCSALSHVHMQAALGYVSKQSEGCRRPVSLKTLEMVSTFFSAASFCCCFACFQAALGYVSEQSEGFVDFDAVLHLRPGAGLLTLRSALSHVHMQAALGYVSEQSGCNVLGISGLCLLPAQMKQIGV
jgi:hypothetical protein